MNTRAMFLIVILIVVVLALIVKLASLHFQIHRMTMQLEKFIRGESRKKLDISLSNRQLEGLAEKINESIRTEEQLRIKGLRQDKSFRENITNISHDLRTPLTSVIGYLLLSENEHDDDRKQKFNAIAIQKALLLQSLIDYFFELSLIDSDAHHTDKIPIDINKLLQDEILAAYADFEGRKITPSISLPNRPVMIAGDMLAMERIIGNLISNAISYTTDFISFGLEERNDFAVLSVKNASPPLSKQEQEALFQRFYRGGSNRTSGHAGLGLYIVKTLTEKMDGQIETSYSEGVLSIMLIEGVLSIMLIFKKLL